VGYSKELLGNVYVFWTGGRNFNIKRVTSKAAPLEAVFSLAQPRE
jgi:hypothetical protein